jgi:hypothetical protein
MIWIKKFFEHNSTRGTISSAELIAFKRACTAEEWDAYVKQAEAYFQAVPA